MKRTKSWLLMLALVAPGCRAQEPPPAAQREAQAVPRELGAWTGKGNATLGFVSESGSFRINWIARRHGRASPGRFQLTLRSGISGRPMKVVADHRGPGGGSVEVGDDPRMYEFLVESAGIEWSISVEETFAPRR